jgi:hypothetical protein
MKDQH